MRPTTPEGWWMEYRQALPSDYGRAQLLETKKAFAAGMYAVMQFMTDVGNNDDDAASDALLEKFSNELVAMGVRLIQAHERDKEIN